MTEQDFRELLRSRELKATGTRLRLLTEMEKYASAMPYTVIKEVMPSADRVTLYRTLEILLEKGIIHKALQDKNDIYYAVCDSKCDHKQHRHDHLHFQCVRCNSVTCEKPTGSMQISLPHAEIHSVSVHVRGVCRECR